MTRWLPLSTDAERALRWRVSDASAAAIAEALLSTDGSQRIGTLAKALARDPHFALWCVCRAALVSRGERLQTVESLAAWLASNALRAVVPVDDCDSGPNDDSGPPEPWADRAAFQVQLAESAVARASGEASNETSEAYLLGLLWRAGEWTEELAPGNAPRLNEVLPDWLRGSMNETVVSEADADSCDASEKSAATCVAAAFALVSSGREAHEAPSSQAAACEQSGAEARREWLANVAGPGVNLGGLAGRLHRLAQLEKHFSETLEAEKLEAVAEFAAGAGHEINNPLAVISGRAQLFLQHERNPGRRRELALINSQTMRIYEMIADMMLFARPPSPVPARFDLSTMIDQLLAELTAGASTRQIKLTRVGSREPLWIEADVTQCMIAVKAICENAISAIGQSGRIEIEIDEVPHSDIPNVSTLRDESAEFVQITIRDDGPGIPDQVRRHLFDPFYSGRGAGRGLGLGLSKCWRIVTNHGGRIDVESYLQQGATFKITLPVEFRGQSADDASRPSGIMRAAG